MQKNLDRVGLIILRINFPPIFYARVRHLPGDIYFGEEKTSSFYFPIVTLYYCEVVLPLIINFK